MKSRIEPTLYATLLVLAIGLVWSLSYFPSQDGPIHLYNARILRDLRHDVGPWSTFYEQGSLFLPNLGFTLIAYPLLGVVSPLVAERVFLTLYIVLFGLGLPWMLAGFGRRPWTAALIGLVALFHYPLMLGFYSYTLGVPLLMFGVGVAWRIRERKPLVRAAAINGVAAVLFPVHLVVCALFLIAVALLGFARGEQPGSRIASAARELSLGSPAVAAVVIYVLTHAGGTIGGWRPPWRLLGDLVFFSSAPTSRLQLVPAAIVVALILAAAVAGLRRPGERGRFLLGFVLVLIAVYFVAPRRFGGGALFNERLPVIVFLFALPLIVPPGGRGGSFFRAAAAVAATLAIGLNLALLGPVSRQVVLFARGLEAALPAGSTIVTCRYDTPRGTRYDPLLNASAYFGLAGAIDLGNYAATVPHFVVRFRDGSGEWPPVYAAYRHPRGIEWSRFPVVDYLLAWNIGVRDRPEVEAAFDRFWADPATPLTIWRRRDGPP